MSELINKSVSRTNLIATVPVCIINILVYRVSFQLTFPELEMATNTVANAAKMV